MKKKKSPPILAPVTCDPVPSLSRLPRYVFTRPRDARPSVRAFATARPTPVGAPRPAGTVLMW